MAARSGSTRMPSRLTTLPIGMLCLQTMAKKGKEIDVGGLRIQVDPIIIGRRILMRQKLTLAAVAIAGGLTTAVLYKTTPKTYTSDATIAVRVDALDEVQARTLVNRAMRDLNADGEMMLMV